MPRSRLYKGVMVSRRYSKISRKAPVDIEEVMMNLDELRALEDCSGLTAE